MLLLKGNQRYEGAESAESVDIKQINWGSNRLPRQVPVLFIKRNTAQGFSGGKSTLWGAEENT